MDLYRIYGLDKDGRIRHGEYVDAPDDAQAVGAACRLLTTHSAAEVWFGKRRVAGPSEVASRLKS